VSGADEGLTPAELEAHDVSALPDREAMSTLPASLLDLDVNVDAAQDLAAPVNAAEAANANAALPVDAAASANVLSEGATSVAQSNQTSVIDQDLDGVAIANPDQASTIDQGETPTTDTPTTEGQ
jgi:hypothetical protein